MRCIDLPLDQLSTNSFLCRLRYDSPPCSSSSLLFSESVPSIYIYMYIYIERERERAIQKTYRAKNEKEPIQHKKEGSTVEREK